MPIGFPASQNLLNICFPHGYRTTGKLGAFIPSFKSDTHFWYLSGAVRDSSNNPKPYARISIYQSTDGSLVATGVADSNGLYSIRVPGQGFYQVAIVDATDPTLTGVSASNLVAV